MNAEPFNLSLDMKFPYTGVILSGGLNTRFSGKEKAFIQVGGKRILDRLYSVFSDLFNEIILVTNEPLKYIEWDLNIVTDLFSSRSSLTGIHAGLFYMKNPFGFFSACDTPFLKKEVVETIVGYIDSNVDLVMPETSSVGTSIIAHRPHPHPALAPSRGRGPRVSVMLTIPRPKLARPSRRRLG